jgi:hypothetical protein
VSYSWGSTFIISAQNVIHEIHCTPWQVSSWTAASVQRCRDSCELTDIHNAVVKCLFGDNRSYYTTDSRCPRGKKSEGVKCCVCGGHAIGPLLIHIDHDRYYWELIAWHLKKCRRTIMNSFSYNALSIWFRTHVDMGGILLVSVCGIRAQCLVRNFQLYPVHDLSQKTYILWFQTICILDIFISAKCLARYAQNVFRLWSFNIN